MPKLYEYLGLVILFYSNEHQPIHVHGKYQGQEGKAIFTIIKGKIIKIEYVSVRGHEPLNSNELKKFKSVVSKFKEDIVKKWVDFFILNKEIKSKKITQRLD